MESIQGITAKITRLAETDRSSVQSALQALREFDVRLLVSKHVEVRRLAIGYFFSLIGGPRLKEASHAYEYAGEVLGKSAPERLYLPLVALDDIFYLCFNDEQKKNISTFHESLAKLVKKTPGFLQKKLFASVGINSKDGLITSFEHTNFKNLAKQLGEVEDPSLARNFCCGVKFWKNHADIQFCRVGGGEEEVPSISEISISNSSEKSMEEFEGIEGVKSAKVLDPIATSSKLGIYKSSNDLSKSVASFGMVPTANCSTSKTIDARRRSSNSNSNSTQLQTSSKKILIKGTHKSSFAQHSSKPNLNMKSCDKHGRPDFLSTSSAMLEGDCPGISSDKSPKKKSQSIEKPKFIIKTYNQGSQKVTKEIRPTQQSRKGAFVIKPRKPDY